MPQEIFKKKTETDSEKVKDNNDKKDMCEIYCEFFLRSALVKGENAINRFNKECKRSLGNN